MYRNKLTILFCLPLLTLTSCTKVWDYFKQNPDHPGANCRIEQISFESLNTFDEIIPSAAYFSYNTFNNPTLIRFDIPYDLWPMDKAFRYDAENRLIVYVEGFEYPETVQTLWHKYIYINPMKIIDSVFTYTTGDYMITDRPDDYSGLRVYELTLDFWGRIINEKRIYENSNISEKIFRYDHNGNIIKPGITYTTKPNIRQTNKIWQFIDRDYSVHQPEHEVGTFTSFGMPHTFTNIISTYSEVLTISPSAVITYNCE